jgi:hypothetical protein
MKAPDSMRAKAETEKEMVGPYEAMMVLEVGLVAKVVKEE